MEDGHVGHAEGPRELPRCLQPSGHAEVGQDGPRLVDHHDGPVAVLGPDRALQPGRRAGHENAEGRRVVDGGKVQHHQRSVEAEPGRGRPVEHAAEVAVRPGDAVRGPRPGRPPSAPRVWCGGPGTASMLGSRRASTTCGRVGAGIRATRAHRVASPTAASMAARSGGGGPGRDRPRPTTRSAPPVAHDFVVGLGARLVGRHRGGMLSGSRRLESAGGRSSVSSGLSRTGPPGRRATGATPHASASGPYSPLGSITQARRPKTAWRQRYDFTKELLPLPI